MKGLILKDLMGLKKIAKNYLIFIVFYAIISSFSNMHSMFSAIIMILAFMLPITALSFDERAKWEGYALTMPLSRKDIVLSKYLLGLIFAVISYIVSFLYTFLIAGENIGLSALISGAFFLVGMLYFSITFPIIIKLGVEKGRLTMIIIILIPIIAIITASKLGVDLSNLTDETFKLIAIISCFATIGIYIVSIFFSIKVFNKKEL